MLVLRWDVIEVLCFIILMNDFKDCEIHGDHFQNRNHFTTIINDLKKKWAESPRYNSPMATPRVLNNIESVLQGQHKQEIVTVFLIR